MAGPGGTLKVSTNKKIPRDFDKSFDAYKTQFETYVRHPSIVIYILSNEMPFKGKGGDEVHAFLNKMFDRLAAWDHTRLYIGNAGYGQGREGDINDVHRYWGWYYNTFLTYFNIRDEKLFGDYTKNQPLTFSECVGNFTGPNGAYNDIERKQLAAQLCWTGYSPDQVGDAQAYQGFMNKQAIETFRRLREQNPRVSGLMPFTIAFHNWAGIKSFDQMIPTAAAKQFGISYNPVLLSLEHWQPQLYAGAETTVHLHVVNDADDFSDLNGAKMSWVLRGKQAKELASGKVGIPTVPYYAAWTQAIALKLPANAATSEYTLSGAIEANGKIVATNEIPLFIAGADYKPAKTNVQRKILIYDPHGTTAKAIANLKFEIQGIDNLSKLQPAKDLLIIGEQAWDAKLTAGKSRLADFVHSGGRVLCLGQLLDNSIHPGCPRRFAWPTVSASDSTYTPKDAELRSDGRQSRDARSSGLRRRRSGPIEILVRPNRLGSDQARLPRDLSDSLRLRADQIRRPQPRRDPRRLRSRTRRRRARGDVRRQRLDTAVRSATGQSHRRRSGRRSDDDQSRAVHGQ